MRPKKVVLIIVTSVIVILSICVAYVRPHFWYIDNLQHPIDYFVYELDYKRLAAMKSIELGMSEEAVISILGKPEEVSYKEYIEQSHGRKSEYKKKILNPHQCYWYSTGIDVLACIIFDQDNKVIYVNVGGT